MTTCTTEEAKNYKCCMMDKQCEGDACMAWKKVYVNDQTLSAASEIADSMNWYGMSHTVKTVRIVDSGKGHCGHIKY